MEHKPRTKEKHPTFGENLSNLRKEYGIQRKTLGESLGIDEESARRVIESWESGSREPSLLTVCKIADFFGVSTDRLLGRETQSKFIQTAHSILVRSESDMTEEEKNKILAIIAAFTS